MMNKELQVLYKIFELELSPPIKPEYDDIIPPGVYNKHSEIIGGFRKKTKRLYLDYQTNRSVLSKIKQTFNLNTLSNDDVFHIAKHLVNWLQDNFPEKLDGIKLWNPDTYDDIYYPKRDLDHE